MQTRTKRISRWLAISASGFTLIACSGGTGPSDATTTGAQGDQSTAGLTGGDATSTGGGSSTTGSTGSGGGATTGAGGSGLGTAAGGMSSSTGGAGSGGTSASAGGADGSGGALDGSGGFTGTCTESQRNNTNASGSGPHDVVVETNSDAGINEGTIFRPADLGGGEKYPIFVWGQGGCSRDGLGNSAAMAEIASHGYFVIADGTPNNTLDNRALGGGGDVLLKYIDWAIEENAKPCSAYFQSLDTEKVAANGFSCGGLMAAGTAADPRMTTWGHTSSGSFSEQDASGLANRTHTPVLIITGTADSLGAHENGKKDFDALSASGDIPVMMFSKIGADHGGDLWAARGGEFTAVNLAWLNWWLKGDEGATGKGQLVGGNCPYCSDNSWIVESNNLP